MTALGTDTNLRQAWLKTILIAAKAAGHIFPDYAACEAALESGYGASQLAREHNNLFGMKQHAQPVFTTVELPTWEVVHGQNVRTAAGFVHYPTLTDCFKDRMATLQHVASYKAAREAKDGKTFVIEVSKHWSTDPRRAQKVLAIHDQFAGVLG